MLTELRVENLGVIAELGLVFGPGMTAVTGETGTGKTLVVEAIELLVGARADSTLVRAGADEARVEARFEVDAELAGRFDAQGFDVEPGELVLARAVPREGRSRAYLNGRLVPAATLAQIGSGLIELHGQHAHRALVTPTAQREALDRFAGEAAMAVLDEYRASRLDVQRIDEELAGLGGDPRERARTVDLLRFQVEEIDAAEVEPDEEGRLAREASTLADAAALRQAAAAAHGALEDGAVDAIGAALEALEGREAFGEQADRIRVLQAEVGEMAREIRSAGEGIEEDPARLEAVQARRALLADLRRKYGDSLVEVLAYRQEAENRLDDLLGAEARTQALERDRVAALERCRKAAERLSAARHAAAPDLGRQISDVLRELAMPSAVVEVEVVTREWSDDHLPEDGVDDVMMLLGANVGEPPKELARVASGGELARTMLAARVVLSEAPPTLVFDEVDAGIGGQAGVAVGRKLSLVGREHQVVCVTHLAQVAAFARTQVVVDKHEEGGRTVARIRAAEGADRVNELSRMLAGSDTEAALDHAEELLASASREQPR